MADIQILNNQAHASLKIANGYPTSCADYYGSTMVFASEIERVQAEYSIFFRKDPDTSQFYPCIFLGFAQDENLFIEDNKWLAHYIPLAISRGPFVISLQQRKQVNGGSIEHPVVGINVNHPNVNSEKGEAIFDAQGNQTEFAEVMTSKLNAIQQGLQENKKMIDMFNQFDLIEPVSLDVELADKQNVKLQGIYTINDQKLAQLSADALYQLNNSGFLPLAFFIARSINNISVLINKKNAKLVIQDE